MIFEKETSLEELLLKKYKIIEHKIYDESDNYIGEYCPKNKIYKEFLEPREVNWVNVLSSKLLPDEALYVKKKKDTVIKKSIFYQIKKTLKLNFSIFIFFILFSKNYF